MITINLKDIYPYYYTDDHFIEVSDEIADIFISSHKHEHAYNEKVRYHQAYFSLDVNDGIENNAINAPISPPEIYERKYIKEEIHYAIQQLPVKQARRIYAYFFYQVNKKDIASIEGIDESSVRESINRGLINLGIILNQLQFDNIKD